MVLAPHSHPEDRVARGTSRRSCARRRPMAWPGLHGRRRLTTAMPIGTPREQRKRRSGWLPSSMIAMWLSDAAQRIAG